MSGDIESNVEPVLLRPQLGTTTWWAKELGRLRGQLAGAILLLAGASTLMSFGRDAQDQIHSALTTTFFGLSAGVVATLLVLRQLKGLPGVLEGQYILPVSSLGFGAALGFVQLAGMEIDSGLFLIGATLSVIWLKVTKMIARQLYPRHFAVLPIGIPSDLFRLPCANWTLLDKPQLPPGHFTGVVGEIDEHLPPEWEQFIAECVVSGQRVVHTKEVRERLSGKVDVEHISKGPLGANDPDALDLKLKFLTDWLLALVAAVVLSPLFLLVSFAIRLTSPGPALFRQTRVGLGGRKFAIYKFRTMRWENNPGASRSAAMTEVGDARITLVGGFLRRTRLDELAQIINILRGEMSWIGPRPEATALSAWYENEIPYYRYRHAVRPGISGWAQVNQGHVTSVDSVLEKLQYDFFYIKHFSPWLDLLIALKTIRTMATGFGAR